MPDARLVGPLDRPAGPTLHDRILAVLPLFRGWGYPDYKATHTGFPSGVYGGPKPSDTGHADCVSFTAGIVGHVYQLSLDPSGPHRRLLMLHQEAAERSPWATLDHLVSLGLATPSDPATEHGWHLCQSWKRLDRNGRFVAGQSTGHSWLALRDSEGSLVLDSGRSTGGPTWRGVRPVGPGEVPQDRTGAVAWERMASWFEETRAVRLL